MRAIWTAVFVLLTGCLEDLALENRTFPCRRAEDCVEGFVCDPNKWVCARPGQDSGVADASSGANIGESCASRTCAVGTCVDGVCCSTPCDGECERCDITPGTCEAIPEGTDPDSECGASVDCGTFVCERLGGTCYACVEGPATSTCNGAGACNAGDCLAAGRGRILGTCHSGCLQPGTCEPGQLAADNDEVAELCSQGGTCTQASGDLACCSPEGTCCPGCDARDSACE